MRVSVVAVGEKTGSAAWNSATNTCNTIKNYYENNNFFIPYYCTTLEAWTVAYPAATPCQPNYFKNQKVVSRM
jgi:hypothetical protein